MKDWLYPGAKVVCVDDDYEYIEEGDPAYDELRPKARRIYTVRAVVGECGSVQLNEIINRPRFYSDGFGEVSFRASRFRPLTKRTTDISIFREMLNTVPEQERV